MRKALFAEGEKQYSIGWSASASAAFIVFSRLLRLVKLPPFTFRVLLSFSTTQCQVCFCHVSLKIGGKSCFSTVGIGITDAVNLETSFSSLCKTDHVLRCTALPGVPGLFGLLDTCRTRISSISNYR